MSIDWITVAAQIANFLVLVWLLKRFLYRPILDGIDAREAEITARMAEAEQEKAKAAAVEADYNDRVRALNVAQAEMTGTIRKQAEEQRDTLLAEAQQRMEREHERWQAERETEARAYIAKLHGAGANALLSLTRKALVDLADETLEARIAQHLLGQIKPMAADMAGKATAAVITSHAPLTAEVQAQLTGDLTAEFPSITVRFDTDPEQAPGLILRIGGVQVAWTVDSYIDGLDALIADRLAQPHEPKARPYDA